MNPQGAPADLTILYGPGPQYGNSLTLPQLPTGLGAVSITGTLQNLTPGAICHYAIQAANLTGTTQGADQTFQTAAQGSPTVTTGSATNLTTSGATLNATIDPNGPDTSVWFQYGTDITYGSTTPAVDLGTGFASLPVSGTLQGLLAGVTYHFRAAASNTNGTVYGLDQSFVTSTSGLKPTLLTAAATNVGLTSAVISALVTPNGADTTVNFESGTNTSYGTVSPSIDAGAGMSKNYH